MRYLKGQCLGANLVTTYNIDNYIRHIVKGDKIEIDRFIQSLYALQGKDLGIGKTTIRAVASKAIAEVLKENEQANEVLTAGMGDKLIEEGENCYVFKKATLQGIVEEPFTTFTIKVLKREQLDNGEVHSLWRLESVDGRVHEITVGMSERASQQEFTKQVCMVDGFMYRCPPIAGFHNMFMRYIEKDVTCAVVRKCGDVGKHGDVWLFDEFGIDKKGRVQGIKDGSYVLDKVSYMPPLDSIPRDVYRTRINMARPAAIQKESVSALLRLLERNYGSKIAWIVLGWIGACFARDKVMARGWGFPVCYITGNAQSGKTTLAKWMLKAAGYMNASALGAKSSIFGINYLASVYSNLPLWFDDIRGLGEDGIWNSVILGAYENAGDLKGTKDRSLTANIQYKAGILITSEFFMKSPAAQSRCVQLVADESIQCRLLYKDIDGEIDHILPYLGIGAILRIQKNEVNFVELLDKYREMLTAADVKSRSAQNFAIVLAGFELIVGQYVEENTEIMEEMVQYCAEVATGTYEATQATSYASELVKDIGAILLDRQYKEQFKCGEDWLIRGGKLYLKTSGLYDTWRKYKGINNVKDYNTRQEFVAQIRRLTYAVRNSAGTATINGKKVTVICLDLDKMREEKDPEINTLPALLEDMDTSEFI